MPFNHANVVLVPGAWADGSSWGKVIGPLKAAGLNVIAAPLPLTSLTDDVAAVDRVLERFDGPVVLAGHAYAGAVIGATNNPKVAALVYISALAPDEGETVGDVFYRGQRTPSRSTHLRTSRQSSPPFNALSTWTASASRSGGPCGRTGRAGS
jgi:hypothetical protein